MGLGLRSATYVGVLTTSLTPTSGQWTRLAPCHFALRRAMIRRPSNDLWGTRHAGRGKERIREDHEMSADPAARAGIALCRRVNVVCVNVWGRTLMTKSEMHIDMY